MDDKFSVMRRMCKEEARNRSPGLWGEVGASESMMRSSDNGVVLWGVISGCDREDVSEDSVESVVCMIQILFISASPILFVYSSSHVNISIRFYPAPCILLLLSPCACQGLSFKSVLYLHVVVPKGCSFMSTNPHSNQRDTCVVKPGHIVTFHPYPLETTNNPRIDNRLSQ